MAAGFGTYAKQIQKDDLKCGLPQSQRACPSTGLDGTAILPVSLVIVNRLIRIKRYCEIFKFKFIAYTPIFHGQLVIEIAEKIMRISSLITHLSKAKFIMMSCIGVAFFVLCGISINSDAQTRLDWRKWKGVNPKVEYLPALSRDLPMYPGENPSVNLRITQKDKEYSVWVDNYLYGDVQVTVFSENNSEVLNNFAMPVFPITKVVNGGQTVLLSVINLERTNKPTKIDLAMETIFGTPINKKILPEFIYKLPFDYEELKIDQGFGGTFSHQNMANYYSLDFALPIGTPIYAARDGRVMQVENRFENTTSAQDNNIQSSNLVRIVHDDNTMALYAHLDKNITVEPGQKVTQGKLIGYSGNSGFSTGPHLHFSIQVNRNNQLESIPFRINTPSGELKQPSSSIGIR